MERETEIKLRISDVRRSSRLKPSERARRTRKSKVHEENVIFDTPQGGLPARTIAAHSNGKRPKCEKLERRKGAKQRVVLTFKQPMVQTAGAGMESASYSRTKVRDRLNSRSLTRESDQNFRRTGMSGCSL